MPTNNSAEHLWSSETHLPRRESMGYQINHLARLLEAALRVRIAPHGVAPGQFAQLLALFEGDGISQTELCNEVHIDQSTMVHTLRRMERDGLVTRMSSSSDGRRIEIRLTDHARGLEPTLVACAQDANTVATAGTDSSDLATTRRVLAEMIHNLQVAGYGAPS